jgi:acetylornithine deacetylase/succinyl-diaminopimelate desuccinylase-like protein
MEQAMKLWIGIFFLLPALVLAQSNPAAQAARQWRQQHERAIVEELAALLAIPNVSSDRENIQRNAAHIAAMMEKRGIATRLVTTPGANPLVFGELRTPGATRTIVFYAHYDGQPIDPAEWATPPFDPVLRDRPLQNGGTVVSLPAAGPIDPEWRLYARSSADDKAPLVALMAALDGIRAAGLRTRSHIKFVFDGEEEIGSPNLEKMLAANKDLFSGDLWLFCDGPLYQTRQQSIIFGARGIATFDVTVYGPRAELHSGHYGNWAPNPALSLARLLASMKDPQNDRVLVDGFYDEVEPLTDRERKAIADAPAVDAALVQELWLGTTEGRPKTLNELIAQPSLNIRGMASARVGTTATNIIPASATATLDVRLVKKMSVQRTFDAIRAHVRKQGFHVVDAEPAADVRRSHPRVARVVLLRGAEAARTSMDLPVSQEVIRTVESVRGRAVSLPTMGGQLPLDAIERAIGTRTIIIPIGNHDNNQHSANENLRIQNLWDGIELMAALLTMEVPADGSR